MLLKRPKKKVGGGGKKPKPAAVQVRASPMEEDEADDAYPDDSTVIDVDEVCSPSWQSEKITDLPLRSIHMERHPLKH